MREINIVAAIAVLLPAVGLSRGVAVGENILNNPELLATEKGLPLNWNHDFETNNGRMIVIDGATGKEVVFLPGDGTSSLKQEDIRLVPGAKYRLGAWVKTKDLKADKFGFVVTPWAWLSAHGPDIPADTGGEWRWIEEEIEAPPSNFETYACRVYTVNHRSGGFSVKGLSLKAVEDAGARGVERAPKIGDYRRITPLMPRLEDIPAGDSKFLFAYIVPDSKLRKCRVWIRMDNEEERYCGEFPVIESRFEVALSGMKSGARGVLRAESFCNGTIECSVRYNIAVRDAVATSRPAEKKLNNMVTRLLTAVASDGESVFSAEHDGWVFIAIERADAGLEVRLDSLPQPLVPSCKKGCFEAMVRISRGDHCLRVKGAIGGTLIVNAIPELYCYPIPGNLEHMVKEAPFRGDFFTNRIYTAFNMFGYGWGNKGLTAEELEDFRMRGKERVGHALPWRENCEGFDNHYEPAELLAKRLRKQKLQAYTYDEIFITSFKPKWIYADAMRSLQSSESVPCTWSSGHHFPHTALDAEYYSACLNASHGKGRFFFEVYPRFDSADISVANAYMDNIIDETCRRAQLLVPDGMKGSHYVMGLYTKIGNFCYDVSCDSDPKWYYNRYIQKLVTLPSLDGLAGFGMYSYHNAEEEDVRWVCALVRHYLLKGRIDDFAAKNGIKLDPKIVKNGNFIDGLKGWTVDGDVRAEKIPGYAQNIQRRRWCRNKGDDVAVFRRISGKPSLLRQRVSGLEPGRLYALRYVVSPMKEIIKGATIGDIRRYGITANVNNAEDVTALMPVAHYGGAECNMPRLNVRTLVFKALESSATLNFNLDNDDTADELVLSAVRVRPYFLD